MILSDLTPLRRVTYDDYVEAKGFPILSIIRPGDDLLHFTKEFNKLRIYYVEESEGFIVDEYNLDDRSILDVLNIMYSYDNTLDVSRYKENPETLLYASALFLADFDTRKEVRYQTTLRPISKDLLLSYTDRFNSEYKALSIDTESSSGEPISHFTEKNNLFLEDQYRGTLRVRYSATNLKLTILKEFILSDISQLYTFNSDQ